MNKHTATFNGHTFTRNSKARTYSHVVLEVRADGSPQLGSVTWCGRPDLAEKVKRSYERLPGIAAKGHSVHMIEATIQ